jgi:hypothetical protein
MTFSELLNKYTVAQIIEATGCTRGTAYDWKCGRRNPPIWQQRHWLKILSESTERQNSPIHA